jgi:hypothetical protein
MDRMSVTVSYARVDRQKNQRRLCDRRHQISGIMAQTPPKFSCRDRATDVAYHRLAEHRNDYLLEVQVAVEQLVVGGSLVSATAHVDCL